MKKKLLRKRRHPQRPFWRKGYGRGLSKKKQGNQKNKEKGTGRLSVPSGYEYLQRAKRNTISTDNRADSGDLCRNRKNLLHLGSEIIRINRFKAGAFVKADQLVSGHFRMVLFAEPCVKPEIFHRIPAFRKKRYGF